MKNKWLALFVVVALICFVILVCIENGDATNNCSNLSGTDDTKTGGDKSDDDNQGNNPSSNYSEGLNYKLMSDGSSYEIIGIGSCVDENIVIPLSYNSKKIISIADNAFSGYSFIKSIKLTDNITSIGTKAFYNCSGIESLIIPKNVIKIGEQAFAGTGSIKSLEFRASIIDANYGNWVFSGIGQNTTGVSLVFSDDVTVIPRSFVNQFNLVPKFVSIKIGKNVKEIGQYAFSNCQSVMELNLPNGVERIGKEIAAGSGYANNQNHWTDGVLINNGYLIESNSNVPTTLSFKNVKVVSSGCFSGNSTIQSVSFTGPLKSIGVGAFNQCIGLKNLTINSTVENKIERNAFGSCGLERVSLGNTTREIGDLAFHLCYSLSNLSLGTGLISIGNDSFGYCYGLTSLSLPIGISTIGDNAFDTCKNLQKIYFPSSITSVGKELFRQCTITNVYCESKIKPTGWDSLWDSYGSGNPKIVIHWGASQTEYNNV